MLKILESKNKMAGFFRTAYNQSIFEEDYLCESEADAKWRIAFAMIYKLTLPLDLKPERIRDYLDSQEGRYLADKSSMDCYKSLIDCINKRESNILAGLLSVAEINKLVLRRRNDDKSCTKST